MISTLLAVALSTQSWAVAKPAQLRHCHARTRAPTLVLDKQAIRERFNVVPAFTIVNDAGQPMASDSQGTPVITFHIDVAEAQALLARIQASGAEAALKVVPLGNALAMSSQQSQGAIMKVQSSRAEYARMRQSLGFNVTDVAEPEGGSPQIVPLFYSELLKFEESGEQMMPMFFGMDDFRAAWTESGLPADEMPVQLTDLRKLQNDLESDESWLSTVLMPPEASMKFLRGGAG